MTTRSERLPDVGRVRLLASGHGFTQSPVWCDHGRLYVASVNRGVVYEAFLNADSPVQVAEPGGGPNGLAVAGAGLLVCQNGGLAMPTKSAVSSPPGIQRIDARGVVTTVRSGPFASPSDCVMGPDGRLWFTDPADHVLDDSARPGRVWTLDLVTGEAMVVIDDILFPNGIAFSPDYSALYVAESATRRVLRFRLDASGTVSRYDWACPQLPGVPDGLAIDAEAHVWVACSFSGDIVRLSPDGGVDGALSFGDAATPTALCFAGAELDQLVVTSAKGGTVIALHSEVPGAQHPSVLAAGTPSP